MKNIFYYILHKISSIGGFKLIPKEEKVSKDMDMEFRPIYELCRPYSMTSIDQMYALYEAVKYAVSNNIPGDFVECGVWKGGSAMLIGHTLHSLNVNDKKIYLYDTFEGMPEPDKRDIKIKTGVSGNKMWKSKQQDGGWYNASQEEVTKNVFTTPYPKENFIFVKGKVEETIPSIAPSSIALLRLDTDWFSSTYHELKHLFPLLQNTGILIIDDYGSWSGSREATDTYFSENNIKLYLHKVGAARIGIKVNKN